MSLEGRAAAKKLRGKINGLDVIYTDTYEIAVANGYEGTVDEWLASLKGEKGEPGADGTVAFEDLTEEQVASLKGDPGKAGADGITPHIGSNGNWFIGTSDTGVSASGGSGGSSMRISQVTLLASAWTGVDSLHSQVVTISGITQYSKVDLLPSVEQLAIFHDKDVAFVTENEDGVVTVYAIGEKPTNDYTMQVSITEVFV